MINKHIVCSWFVLCMIFTAMPSRASDDFQQWLQQQAAGMQAQKKAFQEYKDQRDREFTAFLKAQWKAIDILKGEIRDKHPKPDVMPVAPERPVTQQPVKPPRLPPVVINVPEQVVTKEPVVSPVVVPPVGKLLVIDFYGRLLRFYYDPRLQQRLNFNINKDTISNYWSALSQTDYEDLLKQLSAQNSSLELNDWAYASLVNKLAVKINNYRRNETALLSWFLLAKSGYRARIAYNDRSVYLLVPAKQELFDISYFTLSGNRYYAIDFDGKKQKPGRVFTYDGEYPGTVKLFDMQVSPVVASSEQTEHRQLSFDFDGRQYKVDVTYDRGRLAFLGTYPQLNLNMYFSSGVDRVTATPLQQQLASYMQGMSEQQAVNFLLRFVQKSFRYETDDEQFGEENYLFPEETLFYPYSDCEDRAVLFAWLVHSLLQLDVVGLDYPGHVAAAVNFNEKVTGASVNFQGKSYVITDPTYVNANAGMVMPDYRQDQPRVISF